MCLAYVDDQLLATGKISKGAIIGKQGGVWAASTGYNVSLTPSTAIYTKRKSVESKLLLQQIYQKKIYRVEISECD